MELNSYIDHTNLKKTATVDDIELYIEIFASDELKDSFDKVFVDGAFVQTESKAFLLG